MGFGLFCTDNEEALATFVAKHSDDELLLSLWAQAVFDIETIVPEVVVSKEMLATVVTKL